MRIQIIGQVGSIVPTPDLAINQVSVEKETGLELRMGMGMGVCHISCIGYLLCQMSYDKKHALKSNSCLMLLRGRGVKYQQQSKAKY